MATRQTAPNRPLVILADGGALADLNERLSSDTAPRRDFLRIPDLVQGALAKEGLKTVSPVESRIFCTVGSEKAQSFLTKLEAEWTVRAFPLSFAKYDRPQEPGTDKHRYRLRFHAYLGYVLGLLTGARTGGDPGPVVAIVTDDAHLLPCMNDARAAGIDARLAWWQSSLGEDLSFLAARNGVPVQWLGEDAESSSHAGDRRDSALEGLLKTGLVKRS